MRLQARWRLSLRVCLSLSESLSLSQYLLKALDAEALLHKAASRFFHFDTPPREHRHVLQYRFTVHSNGLCPLILAATDTSCSY